MKPIRIKEEKYRQPASLKVPAVIFGTLLTASAIHQYWQSGDGSQFLSDLHANEMFCRNPEYEEDVFFDPFERAMEGVQLASYKDIWREGVDQKIVHFSFDYNKTTTDNNTGFFRSIPPEIIEDPNVTFILSGHATYDLDDQLGLRTGLKPPKDFNKLQERHLRNNFEIVNGRLDYIKGKLMEAGVPEDRIVLHNLNTRYDKRAVDLEVCAPGHEV